MGIIEILLLAVGLSMDAFAAAVCKGLAAGRAGAGRCLCCGLWFGGAQAAMPVLGWLLGVRFQGAIARVDHWAAFLLLVDDLARTLAAAEIPIGILTAFVGAPFFIYLMVKGGDRL